MKSRARRQRTAQHVATLLLALLPVAFTLPACSPEEPDPKANGASPDQQGEGTSQAAALPPLAPPPADAKELRLLLSGMMDGHLEPCGCASAQAGGVDRRAFWIKINKHRFDYRLEGGNSVRENNPLERQKMQWIQTILGDLMQYDVFPLGPQDLALGKEELELYARDESGAPFLSSDLRVGDKAPFPTHALRQAGTYTLCLVSLAGAKARAFAESARALSAREAIAAALTAAGTRGKDYHCVVLFANDDGPERARQHARAIPGVDVVLSWEHELESRTTPEVVRRDPETSGGVAQTTVLFPGWRGKNMMIWRAKPDSNGNWHTVAFEKEALAVPPDAVKGKRPSGSDAEVWSMLIASKQEIGELGLREEMAERRTLEGGLSYAGTNSCKECHEAAYAKWKTTRHSHAWETLETRAKLDGWPVPKHPDCVRCHSVGYGFKSGFINPQKTPELAAVGCESCHGPGQTHVRVMKELAAEEARSGEKAKAERIRQAVLAGKLRRADARGCVECHDFDQSPGFDFGERWKKIEHGLR